MSATGNQVRRSEQEAVTVACAARMAALFRRLPILVGFTVQENATLSGEREIAPLDEELSLADVTVRDWPGLHPTTELYAEIRDALVEVLEEHPDAREVFRGCTFARAFH